MLSCIPDAIPPTDLDSARQSSRGLVRKIACRFDRSDGADVGRAVRSGARATAAAAAQHRRHHGRRHRHLEHRRLSPRHDGGPHAEPRQDRRRGHAVHRLLRRGKLHGGPRQLHHRPIADPHRHDHRRSGRRAHRAAGGRRRPSPPRSRRMGYATGQFGKNHLGDKNEFLPTVHGFDQFFGYLYHLDAMEDPCHPNYPQDLRSQVGPRNMVRSVATNVDDATVDPRWGKVGKQTIDRRGRAVPEAHGNRGRRNPRRGAEVPRQGQGRQQAVLPLAQSDPHAHRHAPVAEVSGDAQLEERLVHP